MKMKNVVLVLLFTVVSRSVMALGVKINDVSNNPATFIELVFTGNARGLVSLPAEYKSGIHHIKGLYVGYSDDKAFFYNLEQYGLRGAGDITISIDGNLRLPGRAISIKGYTNPLNKEGSRVEGAVKGGSLTNFKGW